jgi:hypothetical protein
MKRRINHVIVIVISFVLLYYSVAWVVLRCAHEEYDPSQDISIFSNEISLNTLSYTPTTPLPQNFECGSPDYRTEFMASSLPPQFDPTAEMVSHVKGILTVRTSSGSGESGLWLRAVFKNPSAVPFLTGLPRYLSLSIFRV